MNIQELKELQIKLGGIISLLIIEDDEKEINNLQKEALEIINNRDFKVHINDDIKGHTILDAVNKCSTGVGQEYTKRKGLEEIEKAIKEIGGKTSKELGRNSSLDDNDEMQPIVSPIGRMGLGYGVLSVANLGTRSGAIFTSEGQAQRVGGVGTILGATFGGLLSVPIMFMGSAAVASTLINRNSEHTVSTREIASTLLESTNETRVGLLAGLGAGLITAMLRIGITPLTFRGGITPSQFNMEFGESLRSGLVAGVAAGVGATLSATLMRRLLNGPSTNLDNTTAQPDMQAGQNR